MKTFCTVLLILSLVSATYYPSWTNDSDSTDLWQPTSLSLSKDPREGQSCVIKACGTVQEQFIAANFYLEAKAGDLVMYSTEIPLGNTVALEGEEYCLKHDTFLTMFGVDNININIELRDKNENRIGAFSFDLEL